MQKQQDICLKGKMPKQYILTRLMFIVLFFHAVAAQSAESFSSWSNGTYTAEATISAPNGVQPNKDFALSVTGSIVDGSGFDVYAYGVYENAVWSYNQNHMIEVATGDMIDSRGFNFGATHNSAFTLNRPPGVYTYTYVFGFRKMGHNYFDVAVDITVIVDSTL
ncbi:MAG: hypothetical protein P8166_03070 [Candidatus Thiodiazotropha sp.]|jgi:hypothetical protein